MRDPNRIERILALLERAWSITPDQRLCQLLNNLVLIPVNLAAPGNYNADRYFFYFEDAHLEKLLEEYIATNTPAVFPPGTELRLSP